MKKQILFLFSILVSATVLAQKPAMLRLSSPSTFEQTAIQWFTSNNLGDVIDIAEIASLDVTKNPVLWVMVDRVGLEKGADKLPDGLNRLGDKNLKPYLEAGGRLLLTNHATQLVVSTGRCSYAPNSFNSGNGNNNKDEWGIQACIGNVDGQIYDHISHKIYTGLEENNNYGHPTFALIGNGLKYDHNCMWDLNAYTDLAANPNKVKDFETKTNSTVIGTWQHVVDYCCAGIVEFHPTTTYKGSILAIGMAALDWSQADYNPNFKKLLKNCLTYLVNPDDIKDEGNTGGNNAKEGLVAYFPLDPTGNIIKEKVANKSFDMNRAQQVYTVDGARGRCVRFDGYSNYVKNAKINISDLSDQDITISIWLAPQIWPHMNQEIDREDYGVVFGNCDDNAKTGFGFYLSNLGHYTFECWTSMGKVKATSGTATLPCSKWNHLVAIIRGSATNRQDRQVYLYNNGNLVSSANTSATFNRGQATFYIGKGAEDVKTDVCFLNAYAGLMDDIEIYNGIREDLIDDNTPENPVIMRYGADRYANNILRPLFHAAPDSGWGNESHGLVYWNNRWHLFYQKNPSLAGINRQSWGHMSSENLAFWEEEYVALQPTEWYDKKGCWSGCVFLNNSFNNGKPTIAYTGVDYARAMINLAAPLDDNLLEWSRMSNPVINGVPSGMGGDFRDCYFFENNDDKYLIVGCTQNGVGCATLHKYNNGAWTNNGLFFKGTTASTCGNMWEMPNITPMGNGKWLFTATPLGTGSGVKCIYWIGTIGADGRFTPQQAEPKEFEMTGTSKDGYGLLSPSIFQKDGKTICVGIVPDKVGLDFEYNNGWAHNYSLPRELSLSADGQTLVQKPYSGLETIRVAEGAYSASNLTTTQQSLGITGRQVELLGEFEVTLSNASAQTGFRVLKSGNNYASVYFGSNTITVDLRNLQRTSNDGGIYNGVYTGQFASRVRPGETMKLHVFLDGSILDVFCNDTYAFSVRLFPTDVNAVEIEAFSTVSTTFKTLQAWKLDATKGITNDIDEIIIDNTSSSADYDNRIYDLFGRQLNVVPAHGMYIKNGRKFINN